MKRFDTAERNSIHELGLRHPGEVLSTNYILKTEQDHSAVNLQKFYSSSFSLLSNTSALILSAFLTFWWGLQYPTGQWSLWFYILEAFLYTHLITDLSISLYYCNKKLKLLPAAVIIALSVVSVGISGVVHKTVGFFTMAFGVFLTFVLVAHNVVRSVYYRSTKKSEENFAQKIIDLYIMQEENKEDEKNTYQGKKIFNDEEIS